MRCCNVTALRHGRGRTAALAALLLAMAGLAQALPIHILVTGDMHGWLQPLSQGAESLGGAAETLAYWKDVEHYKREDFLVLSAGDIATGPALSTVYKGEPDIEVMNAMGYDASALGNHEFDFGLEQLQRLRKEAGFPFVSANVLSGATGADTMLAPFCVVEKLGVKIGVIGLMTTSLKQIAVAGPIRVSDYAGALRLWAPKARAAGAQVLIVLAHVPLDELKETAAQVGDLGIPLMLGGHSHELGQAREPLSGTWIVNSGEWWKAYSKVDLDYDPGSGKARVLSSRQVWMESAQPKADPALKAIIAKWQAKLDADPELGKALGYLGQGLPRFWPVSNFVCDAWLAADAAADLAINNDGALRQDLGPGPITGADLISLMPFNDALYRVALTGKQLRALLPKAKGSLLGLAGLKKLGRSWILTKSGAKLDSKASYQVIVNSYMLETQAALQGQKGQALLVAKNWRDPVLAWLKARPSSAAEPLEKMLDLEPRI
jgi:5'-nucleotidase/UDP-sugar diphosphatase